jgi:hypothetical protein
VTTEAAELATMLRELADDAAYDDAVQVEPARLRRAADLLDGKEAAAGG